MPMQNDFSELWSRSEAVIALFVGWEVLSQNRNIEARISISVEEAFKGHSSKLEQDQYLSPYGKVGPVVRAIKNLAEKMVALKLSGTYRMPAVLWMRLANETGLEIEADTVRRFGAWAIEKQIPVLMKCKHHNTSLAWDAPELNNCGWGDAFGYTPVELLLTKKSDNAHWPYHLEWQTTYTSKPSISNAAAASLLGNARHGEADADEPEVPLKTKAKRKRRKTPEPVEKLIKRYGRLIMEELEKCLQKEAITKDSLLTNIERKDGRYDCVHSLKVLAPALKARYKSLYWEPSSLIRVMSTFVACPPGNRGYEAAPAPKSSKPRRR